MVDYAALFSRNLPRAVTSPPGSDAQTKYIFSVTNAVPEVIDADEYLTAIRAGLDVGGPNSLAAYPPTGGHVGLRELIAQRLSANRGFDASPDDVFISDGAGGAITILLESFINPGDPVLVEEFTYMGSLRMMLERGAEPVHVACDDDGMLPDALEEAIVTLENAGRRPKFVWLIPVYQNPLGFSLSLQRRRALLQVAQNHDIPILENESYADFRIDGDPLATSFSGLSDRGDVFYVSSFTKLLGCGLRVGFGVLPPGVREALPQVDAGNLPRRGVSHLATMMVYEYMREHEAEHIENVRNALLVRRDAMLSALEENFPSYCEWTHPQGGMLVFVRLPEGADTWTTLAKATERDVKYNPGGVFRAGRDRNNYLRLTFSHNSPEEIREGVARLAELFCEEGYFEG